ncbi:MAG: type II toxin-antitoxin system VapC family toxin [Treponema sp.]|nr:type II toxin-antitoxin system VapC family toxin [Treponema sp.]
MKYLIDTHILIWLAVSPEKVSKKICEIIENPQNSISISTVSLWEIAIKLAIKKLDLRALIALCISDDYVFLSHDGKLEQYTQDGLVFIS